MNSYLREARNPKENPPWSVLIENLWNLIPFRPFCININIEILDWLKSSSSRKSNLLSPRNQAQECDYRAFKWSSWSFISYPFSKRSSTLFYHRIDKGLNWKWISKLSYWDNMAIISIVLLPLFIVFVLWIFSRENTIIYHDFWRSPSLWEAKKNSASSFNAIPLNILEMLALSSASPHLFWEITEFDKERKRSVLDVNWQFDFPFEQLSVLDPKTIFTFLQTVMIYNLI